ncbi:ATP-NAD kinase-like domain-containing protein [Mycotypha africana]|uniref:ATP-NAD kinase-like domain-containing protein n=1 Tax=Mycotypha africana TaxID=64632 RepID=UPI002300AB6C|nr:ATP-NAD kinase-like domain-containing protein [Mycotypha africana]KAI8990975.1 ATP-NAD kinase-like domain-containing protein [Mycotypha africana]
MHNESLLSGPIQKLLTSVHFHDTKTEGRPSIYLFIFANPLSGDQKGEDLIQLPVQHFRLRRFPQIQVEIHNILDAKDRKIGIESIKLVERMVKWGRLPTLESQKDELSSEMDEQVKSRHIHVWSAGGDGTVMSVFELLVRHNIDLNHIFFSCIPLGTGNDFSQVLGWGRTLTHPNVLGKRLEYLEQLITERLEKSKPARLDIWQVKMSSHPNGYVKMAGPRRKITYDGSEREDYPQDDADSTVMVRKMCNYMSIGVQGYVGSGFEKHRAGKRYFNMMVYAWESSKWVLFKRFPLVSSFIHKIKHQDQTVLQCQCSDTSATAANSSNENVPELTRQPIDFVIQNIPHIWGREVDLWGDAKKSDGAVENRANFTDPANWSRQLANDGKIEVMTLEDKYSYFMELANFRGHVSKIGQFASPFEILFNDPPSSSTAAAAPENRKSTISKFWHQLFENRFKKDNIICIMCDGEFYMMKNPKSLKIERFAQIWTLGKCDGDSVGRLVKDEDELTSRQEAT